MNGIHIDFNVNTSEIWAVTLVKSQRCYGFLLWQAMNMVLIFVLLDRHYRSLLMYNSSREWNARAEKDVDILGA